MRNVVVVGAGQAAQSLVETLRAGGYDGGVTLVGDEPARPYQRPPLSKAYLLGDMARERLFFRPESFYREKAIDLRTGDPVVGVDRSARTVSLASGERLGYDALALTTGSRPRRLPAALGGALEGVHVVRDLADIDALAPEIGEGRAVVIIGGGYIGLEAAAVARKSGASVTVVEAADRVLARVAPPETAAYFEALHRAQGVDLRCGAAVERIEPGPDDRVASVRLAAGETLRADCVIVGIGAAPNTRLAEEAGLDSENGVVVDAACRTSDPAVVAAGDVARFPYRGRMIRLESVQNAIDQGAAAARTLLGEAGSYAPVPWFWSDQYDVKLQIVGLSERVDGAVVRPGARDGAQSVWRFEDGRLAAVDAMNDPRAYMTAKRWLDAGVTPDPADIADLGRDLKTIPAT